jgi:alpha-1,3-glucosyltransferase
LERF